MNKGAADHLLHALAELIDHYDARTESRTPRHPKSDRFRGRQVRAVIMPTIHRLRASGDGQSRQRFIGRMWRDIGANLSPSYLVKGVLPRDGLGVVWGAKKCGKSFWVFDLVMHVVTGREYRGRKVRQGSAVYIALEGSSGFDNRIEAWRDSQLHRER